MSTLPLPPVPTHCTILVSGNGIVGLPTNTQAANVANWRKARKLPTR